MEKSYRVLIVGSGIIGSSLAMALSERGVGDIGVVDGDLSGKWGSSERNAGGIRATWGQPVNIALSRKSISFFEEIAPEVGFEQKGYLWLYDAAGWPKALQHIPLQRDHGVLIETLSPTEITRRFPFLDRMEGIAGATFSPSDGLINPNLLKTYYRTHALKSKVDWIDHQAVEAVTREHDSVTSVHLRSLSNEAQSLSLLTRGEFPKNGKQTTIKLDILVNAAGAWAPRLACLYGEKIPAMPIRRQVSVMHCHEIDLSPYGMFVDTTGLYFHHEAGHILSGYAISSEPSGYQFEYRKEDFSLHEIWPRLSGRSSFFDRLKEINGWAGLYGMSPDKSAIIGQVARISNLYEAHSFSGHGVMQSYAVGQALADLILGKHHQLIDISSLSGDRFEKDQWVPEEMHI